jgi:D-alanyl-D-alanine carboxypeptidase
MAGLIEDHIDEGARSRTALAITEQPVAESRAEAKPEPPRIEVPRQLARPEAIAVDRSESVQSINRAQPQQVAAYAPSPTPMALERPRPAFIAGTPKAAPDEAAGQRRPVLDGSTGRPISASTSAGLTATPSTMRWVAGPAAARAAKPAPRIEVAKAEPVRVAVLRSDAEDAPLTHSGRPQNAGWMIQIGATDEAAKAQELLVRAKSESHAALGRARPFTEKIQKGHETLWRARFAGLEEDSAEAACTALKRAGFSCFATKN